MNRSMVTWYPVDKSSCPDDDRLCLVYCRRRDVVLFGYFYKYEGGSLIWIDAGTDNPIPDPVWWAEIPYPEGVD